MECFRIDESGYTGFDLLNPEQPLQGAAAIAIDESYAALLIKQHFPNLQATELKYVSLARRPGNHAALLALQRDLLSAHKCVTYVCDKRFMLILMFLDFAVEPRWYRRGVDFMRTATIMRWPRSSASLGLTFLARRPSRSCSRRFSMQSR